MSSNIACLPIGYSAVPPGTVANVATFLEMRDRPEEKPTSSKLYYTLVRLNSQDIEVYRRLFRLVGEDWMWTSVTMMDDDSVQVVLSDPFVEIYVLRHRERNIGLLELDFRISGMCEIVNFGLVKDEIGKGSGRFLMNQAISKAWTHPIDRLWLHTCTFDHPAALMFYQRSGFRPYAVMVEAHEDPRLTGVLPKTAAPHIPLLNNVCSPS